ncbi:MAG: hypothetical protein D6773_18640, partial [Alphaproteobacteria bacterium]
MNKRLFPAGAVALLALFAALAQFITLAHAQISPNDTARYLAGLKPAPGSPLAALTAEPAWQRHAAVLNKAWARLEKNQLAPIRTWSRTHLTAPQEL